MSKNHEMLLRELERTSSPLEFVNTSRRFKPLTEGHARYVEAIKESRVVFCYGPAGSGKTYTATAMALEALLDGAVKKILISRPALESGNRLGFLPGELRDKFKPFTVPVLDVFQDFLTGKEIMEYTNKDIIELCPLAYIRGRSFHDTFMILDEAQNARKTELFNFITRIGRNSRMILNGDIHPAQCDLPINEPVVFTKMIRKFDVPPYVDGVQVVELTNKDIIRDGDNIIGRMLDKLGSL